MNQQRTQQARGEEKRPLTTDMRPIDDMMQYLRAYTRERPETVALVCFGLGFVLGWRLKPW